MQGYVQIYTGEGKGKTTAAIGLSVRAAGAGLKVYFGQFMKKYDYSEILGLSALAAQVTVQQFGTGCYIIGAPQPEDVTAARAGLRTLGEVMASGAYDVVIADEALVAMDCGLLDEKELLALIAARPAAVELVLTGRGATPALVAVADLVTEMTPVKHYYQKGVRARKGIES